MDPRLGRPMPAHLMRVQPDQGRQQGRLMRGEPDQGRQQGRLMRGQPDQGRQQGCYQDRLQV